MSLSFDQLRALNPGGKAVADTACPLCGPECRTKAGQRRKVLRIWDDGQGFITFSCARCTASGWARSDRAEGRKHQARAEPSPKDEAPDRSELARFLWSRSTAAPGTLVEIYLRARGCWLDGIHARFLAARGKHPAAMIARFGLGLELTGVHLTKLAPDGGGKVGSEKDKIMIGPSNGQPIVVRDNSECGELLVAEGIEDAASLSSVTGWTAWAAGAAGRIAPVVGAGQNFERVYLAVDDDRAGRMALDRARLERRGLVALRLGHLLGAGRSIDANKALKIFGPAALLAAIEWSDAQARFAAGEISFSVLQRALAIAEQPMRAAAEPDKLKVTVGGVDFRARAKAEARPAIPAVHRVGTG